MELRPHHILCIQKFTGHGYDAEFTAHMTSVAKLLSENAETDITVKCGCDELCRKCPNNIDGACSTLEKVDLMDRAVLDVCGLSYGDSISWREISARGRERVFKTDEFQKICASCEWFELCQNTKEGFDAS